MGLDQYADGLNKEFYWRKHARLQVFMAREYDKQNPKEEKATSQNYSDLSHLGLHLMDSFGDNNTKKSL